MKNTHLSDDILQAFLLKEIENDSISTHIAECAGCRAKFKNYQHLIGNIKKVNNEIFSFDVTSVVMEKVVQYENKKNAKNNFVFWGILIFLIVFISSFSLPFVSKFLTFFYSIPLFTNIFFIGAGLVVFLFLLTDIKRQYSLKEKQLFENNLQPKF